MNSLKIYPEFTANQTLSHENLNALLQYLDAEQRQTRHQLIGTGILCGFHLHPNGPNTYLTPGIAVTTDGYILAMAEQFNFRYYRRFEDKGQSYIPLKQNVYEVLSEVPEDENVSNLSQFAELPLPIREGVVVVYLEDQLKDIESCEGESCDNKGKEHRLSLKILIIAKNQAAPFVDNNARYYSDIEDDLKRHPAYNLGRLKISRPLITDKIYTMGQLKTLFRNCVDKAKNDLLSYRTRLQKVFPVEFSKLQIFPNDIDIAVNKLKSNYSDFQQVYDWFESVFRAINEWVDLVQSTHLQCINKNRKFPRHVFTGSMTYQPFPPQLFRHYFEAAQTDTMSLDANEILEILSIRVKNLFDEVKINKLNQIAILPEKRSSGKLADRAIPYFFEYGALNRYWNPDSDLIQRLDFDNYGVNREKLRCSFEDKDFFRIDGHVGLSRKEALEELHKLRANYNLEFDIKALYVDKPNSTEFHDCCSYETLRLMYTIASKGVKAQILEGFLFLFKLNKYLIENEYSVTPKLSNYLKNGYQAKDFRHFDIFTSKTQEVDESKLYEGLRNYMEKNPDSMKVEIKEALEVNEGIKESGGDKSSEIYESNEKALREYALKEKIVEDEPYKSISYDLSDNKEYMAFMEGSKNISYQPEGRVIVEDATISKEMEARIDKLMETVDIKDNPEVKKRIEEFVKATRESAPSKAATNIEDFKVISDGIYNLLVNDSNKQIAFVEANPHQAKYGHELLLEKTLPSIMIDLFAFQKKIPENLENFSFESFQDIYLTLIQKINAVYKSLEIVHESFKCHYGIKLIFYILTKINFSSSLAQLKFIEELYTDKQKKLEEKNILANIVRQSPGLEHRAGVPIGGTFFLLTEKGGAATKESTDEEFIEIIMKLLRTSESKNAALALRAIKEKKLTEKEDIIKLLSELGLYGIIGEEVARRGKRDIFDFRDDNMGDDVVIGDFCLNSTIECCDIRYIVHTDIRLDAPKKIYCDDDEKVNLDVHPRGGTISGNGTSQDGHNYMFDPSHPDVKVGENILTYSIADQKVDLIVEVLEHPTARIKVLSKKIDDGTAFIEVEAIATGGTVYEWSYDDEKPEKGNKKHTFNIPADSPEIEVILKLRVSNKACSATDTEKVTLTDVQLILGQKAACNTDKPIALAGKPTGGKFSGTGVSGSKFDPTKVKFAAKEVEQKVDITYTVGDDSETKSIIVVKHPEAVINIIEEKLDQNFAVLRLQNGTEPLKGYDYVWNINGLKFKAEEINNEFKYVDGKVVVRLTAFHPKLTTCQDTAELVFEQPVVDEPPVEEDPEKAIKTFETIKELNRRNIKFFTEFKNSLNSLEFNPDILTGQEIKLVQSQLNFIDQVEMKTLIERVGQIINVEMEELVPKVKKASEAGVAGPELTMYGVRLVTALNVLSISEPKIALGNQFKSLLASINKMKSANPSMRYTLQEIINSDLWLNAENQAQTDKFWSSIQP